jgi:hypothetical protein
MYCTAVGIIGARRTTHYPLPAGQRAPPGVGVWAGAGELGPQNHRLQQLTFVDSVLLVTVFDLLAVRGKFSCKNIPKCIARPELGRTNPIV